MTALDLGLSQGASAPLRPRLPRALRRFLVSWRRRRRQVSSYLDLHRMDERLLYDMGIDPLDVRSALENRATRSILLEPMRRQFEHPNR